MASNKKVADIATQLAALHKMTVSELHAKYQEVFGEPSRSRNKVYLQKKVAWQIQALAEGGLSKKAKDRIQEILDGPMTINIGGRARKKAGKNESRGKPKDSRLPPVGTVIKRTYKDREYEVTVLENGFEYADEKYRSLSKIAKEITGTSWNGFLFFSLMNRKQS